MKSAKSKLCTFVFLIFIHCIAIAQSDSAATKKGWTFGLLPSAAFDSDLGLKYGGLVNFYNFGDGSTYPDYKHLIYLEIARTTKGSGQNQLFFDSGHLFRKKSIRLTADVSWLTEQALDFYGFNGAESRYIREFADMNSDAYISRMYYRYERKLLRTYADFQGNIHDKTFRWLLGGGLFNYRIGSVDIDKLNKGKDEADMLPDTITLYDLYVENHLISPAEADGGSLKLLKAGLIYDTRDIEANPSQGMWSEILFVIAPSFLGNTENKFTKVAVTHRQYFTLLKDKLTFVYRFGHQRTIDGHAPFYYQTMMISSYSPSTITEGLGGAKSLRGMLRNRLIGDAFTYANFEFRYKVVKLQWKKQNIYLAINPFFDAGFISKRIDIPTSGFGNLLDIHFTQTGEHLHYTGGCGLHLALNENFVIAVNYGRAFDRQDGKSGLYIGTNWLF